MKKILIAITQLVLFLFVDAYATFARPFHRQTLLVHNESLTRIFIWDGVIAALILFALFVAIEASSCRTRPVLPWTFAALLLALATGYALKLGFVTHGY